MKSSKSTLSRIVAILAGGAVFNLLGAEMSTPLALQPRDPAELNPSYTSQELTLPVASTIWTNGVGSGFCSGATEFDMTIGGSLGSRMFGSTDAHDLALMKLSVGRVISDVVGSDRWYRGNWELVGELFGGEQFKPHNAHLAGLTALLRYDVATGTKWVPFFDVGAGATETDIGYPDLGGTGQFNLQTGPGVHWFVRKNVALTVQYRFLHLSCASAEHPNHGVNTSAFYAGVSWFF